MTQVLTGHGVVRTRAHTNTSGGGKIKQVVAIDTRLRCCRVGIS